MPSIGSLSVFSIEGDLLPSTVKVATFKQFGTSGLGMIIGADEQPISKLASTSFDADRSAQDATKKAAVSLVGTFVTITRDVGGSPVTVSDCFVKSCTPAPPKSGAGMPGSAQFATTIEWEIITPADW